MRRTAREIKNKKRCSVMSSPLKPNDLDAHFMPFTAQKSFKKKPRMITGAKGMFYYTEDGRECIDAAAGLWCVNAGHSHPKIVEAIRKQAGELDYAANFSFGHPLAFRAASLLCAQMPGDIDHVFFSNSGSESVDTAIKIALAYQRLRGKGTKVKIISRERGYHGVNICGVSIGGISYNRKVFSASLMPNVDFLPHTHNLEQNAFSKGEPDWGAHLADVLESIITLHDAENVAAVIVEPVAGSTGVLVPPKGYLKKLRAICDKYDVLLIFDEVITGWGRLGKATAAERFGILPDIITSAKGINSGAVPMGATFIRKGIYDTFLSQPGDYGADFMHGYTYSGHPLACAAALAAQEVYKEEGLFENAQRLEKTWEDALHGLKGAPHVIDVRNIGLMAAVELDPGTRNPPHEMSRAMELFDRMFFEHDMVMRFTGNVIALSPPLIINESQIGQIVDRLRKGLGDIR